MNEQQAVEFVVRELGRQKPRNEIIRQLCEGFGLDWPSAQKFMQKVEAENKQTIAIRQSPLVTIIGGVIILAGLGLMIGIVMATLAGYVITFIGLPIPYLGNIVYFGTGLAMVIGGLRGVWSVLRNLWNS